GGGRVGVGAGGAVGGTIWAGSILDMVNRVSEFRLAPGSALQAQLVTWEITALAILAGSALAGATTRNGCKQGLAVGVATGVILIGIRLPHSTPLPVPL